MKGLPPKKVILCVFWNFLVHSIPSFPRPGGFLPPIFTLQKCETSTQLLMLHFSQRRKIQARWRKIPTSHSHRCPSSRSLDRVFFLTYIIALFLYFRNVGCSGSFDVIWENATSRHLACLRPSSSSSSTHAPTAGTSTASTSYPSVGNKSLIMMDNMSDLSRFLFLINKLYQKVTENYSQT